MTQIKPCFSGFGCVYVLSNDFIPGLLKIGYTTKDLNTRVREISTGAGVPGKFTVVYRKYFAWAELAEKAVHKILDSGGLRVTQGREFFRISEISAIALVDSVEGFVVPPETISKLRAAAEDLLTEGPLSAEALNALTLAGQAGCFQSAGILVNHYLDNGTHLDALPWCLRLTDSEEASPAHMLAASILQKENGHQEAVVHLSRHIRAERMSEGSPELARRAVCSLVDFFNAVERGTPISLDVLFDDTYSMYLEQRLTEPLASLNRQKLNWQQAEYSRFLQWLRGNFRSAHDRKSEEGGAVRATTALPYQVEPGSEFAHSD